MAPAPALRATACRVDCRWHSNDAAPPQLLMGSMGVRECLAGWMGQQGRKQKAQEMSTTSLGPYVSFYFISISFFHY